MKRVLQIVGGKERKVIEADYECPLRDIDEHYCGHPDSERCYCSLGNRVDESCPLPEADENVLPAEASEFIEKRFGKETDRK